MKVKELLQALGKLDPELDVICYCEDEGLAVGGKPFTMLHVEDVTTRLTDGTPALQLGDAPGARKLVTLDVTTDF